MKISKVPYVQLALEVEKVYNQPNLPESEWGFQSMIVEALIKASGWTMDEYQAQYLSEAEQGAN